MTSYKAANSTILKSTAKQRPYLDNKKDDGDSLSSASTAKWSNVHTSKKLIMTDNHNHTNNNNIENDPLYNRIKTLLEPFVEEEENRIWLADKLWRLRKSRHFLADLTNMIIPYCSEIFVSDPKVSAETLIGIINQAQGFGVDSLQYSDSGTNSHGTNNHDSHIHVSEDPVNADTLPVNLIDATKEDDTTASSLAEDAGTDSSEVARIPTNHPSPEDLVNGEAQTGETETDGSAAPSNATTPRSHDSLTTLEGLDLNDESLSTFPDHNDNNGLGSGHPQNPQGGSA